MLTAPEIRDQLLDWVQSNAQFDAARVTEDSPLTGPDSVVDSLALVSLTLIIEELLGRPIDPDDFADMSRFSSVRSIVGAYFTDARR
ncbi:MAG TPA: acyl carrier protein [Actinoplanes sp.]|nr:acyl carrier protein [Actinoplanes sp.]